MSNVVKKVKKQVISLDFFHILLGEYLVKQKVVVVKPPEWKFMAIIAYIVLLYRHVFKNLPNILEKIDLV